MKVCMILEGCYPYVHGGVSTWMHQYIQAMPDTEFVLWCIGAKAESRGKFKYEIPANVTEIHEVFLDDALRIHLDQNPNVALSEEQIHAVSALFQGDPLVWDPLFELFQNQKMNPVSFLMSPVFLNSLVAICREKFPYISFAEYFHTMRSMLLPELYLMTQDIPEADIYHATCTGYAGILGSMAKWKTGKPFIVTEHGIYTREREEELLRAEWVLSYFKDMWINLFYQFSSCAYHYSDKVTCLFEHAAETQRELGCDASKQMVIENGIHYEKFCDIPVKQENGKIEIAAVVRLARIKDIKTMIYAFMEVKAKIPEAVLYIMGDADDEEYAQECRNLVDQLNIKDLIFTGNVNIMEYFPHLDFTILASISEGQPLSVLESLAAGRPCVTTDVGCCRELLEGKQGDTFGIAGYCVPPMHVDMLAGAMISMCRNRQLRLKMGEAGRQRVKAYYTHEISMDKYRRLYQEVL